MKSIFKNNQNENFCFPENNNSEFLKNGEWQVSNFENICYPPSPSFPLMFSQLWHRAQVKHWEDVSWLHFFFFL